METIVKNSIWMFLGEGSILEMTKDFDVIAENPIDVEESGEGN